MSLAILFNFLRAQHVSDINISIIRSLRLILLDCHIGLIVLGSMCVGSFGVAGLGWYPCSRLKHNKLVSILQLCVITSSR